MKDILQQIQELQEKFDNLYKTKEGEVGLKFVDGTPQFKAVFQGPDVPKLHKLTDIERARKAQEYRAKHSEYDPEDGMVFHEPPEEEKKPIHNEKPKARLPKGDKKMNDNNSYNEIMTRILNLKEDFMNLIEVEGLGQPASDVPPSTNKIKKDKKTKNGKVELVSVEDELFPYDGNKREQYRQKILDTINGMIQGTATLEDLLQIVRQKKMPVKEGLDKFEVAMGILEEMINEKGYVFPKKAVEDGNKNYLEADKNKIQATRLAKKGFKKLNKKASELKKAGIDPDVDVEPGVSYGHGLKKEYQQALKTAGNLHKAQRQADKKLSDETHKQVMLRANGLKGVTIRQPQVVSSKKGDSINFKTALVTNEKLEEALKLLEGWAKDKRPEAAKKSIEGRRREYLNKLANVLDAADIYGSENVPDGDAKDLDRAEGRYAHAKKVSKIEEALKLLEGLCINDGRKDFFQHDVAGIEGTGVDAIRKITKQTFGRTKKI